MELAPSQKETVQHEFDRLCRMVLRGEGIDYDNHIVWRSKHETSLSWLSESQEGQLGVLDEYPCERFCFQVQGYTIPIRSEILANALVKLSEKKRDMLTVRFLRLQKGKMTEYFGWIDNYQLALPKLTTRILKIRPLTCAVCAQSRRSFFIPKIKKEVKHNDKTENPRSASSRKETS